MPFDWSEYLVLAHLLAKEESEDCKRTAISRAYYAVFHAAVALYPDPISTKVDSHQTVWKWFIRKGRLHKKVGVEGQRLKVRRRNADYESEIANVDAEAEHAIQSADRIMGDITRLNPAAQTTNMV